MVMHIISFSQAQEEAFWKADLFHQNVTGPILSYRQIRLLKQEVILK